MSDEPVSKPEEFKPMPGDVLFTRNETVLGRLIRWMTKVPGSPKSLTGHVCIFTVGDRVVEAYFPVTRASTWDWYQGHIAKNNIQWCVMRYKPGLDEIKKVRLESWLEAKIGELYSLPELFGTMMLDAIMQKILRMPFCFFRILGRFCAETVCSGLVGKTCCFLGMMPDSIDVPYMKRGVVETVPIPTDLVDPDELLDWQTYSSTWVQVAKSDKWDSVRRMRLCR